MNIQDIETEQEMIVYLMNEIKPNMTHEDVRQLVQGYVEAVFSFNSLELGTDELMQKLGY